MAPDGGGQKSPGGQASPLSMGGLSGEVSSRVLGSEDSQCPSLEQGYGGAADLAVCAARGKADAWLAGGSHVCSPPS